MAIERKLYQAISDFLINLPMFQHENGRKAILLDAGLGSAIPSIELSGSTTDFVARLIQHLDQFGTIEDQPALILLLQGVKTQVGLDRQKILEEFCQRLPQTRVFIETCPYRGLFAFREQDAPSFSDARSSQSN